MAISGLIVTLSDDIAAAASAMAFLSSDSRLELGESFGRRVVVVAETSSVDADRALWDELRATAGVTHIDVAFVHLDQINPREDIVNSLQENLHAHS